MLIKRISAPGVLVQISALE